MSDLDPAKRIATDESYETMLVTEETAEAQYRALKGFWAEREGDVAIDEKRGRLLDNYKVTYFLPQRAVLRRFLDGVAADRPGDGALSILELGAANGSTLYYLRTRMPLDGVRYLGFEPYDVFVNDFRANCPTLEMRHADAEAFAETDLANAAQAPFDVFFAFGVLCMVPPRIARACLETAATVADRFVVQDYLMNAYGSLSRDDIVCFNFYEKGGQVYFAHDFHAYLDALGFEITDLENFVSRTGKKGRGVFEARRKAG